MKNDEKMIWEAYQKLNEANLISTNLLYSQLENILKEKNIQNQQIKDWFLKTYIKWFKSPQDDDQKTSFINLYQAKETDPEWAKKEGVVQFTHFTPEYKNRLLHIIDFLSTKDEFYLKSLFKITIPQMFLEVEKWDKEMERSAEKSKKAQLQSVEGTDYEVVDVYDGYPVWKLISNKAFREESMYMGHCVGQAGGENKVTSVEGGESNYFRNFKQKELEIYSLRDPKQHNHPVVTFELRKVYGERKFQIVQIKGPANRSVSERYRNACKEFIEHTGFLVKEDGENIGMVEWNDKFYFEDSEAFKKIYKNKIEPTQKERISDIMDRVKDGVVEGSVYLKFLFLKELPDLSNLIINGSFICSYNDLTSLKGAPKEVTGEFSCSSNKLTSLKGAPHKINGEFNCSDNKITSLEGLPSEIGGTIICAENELTSLKGSPNKVNGKFDCSYNKLTSLEGAPKEVNGNFFCEENQLTTLKGAPHIVNGEFDCSYNKLTTLDGAPHTVQRFNSRDNPVKFTDVDIKEAMKKTKENIETKLESFKEFFTENCWKGYKQVGMKPKGKGKEWCQIM